MGSDFSFISRRRFRVRQKIGERSPPLCMYGHTYCKNMDQLGTVVNPARGQLNREN